MFKSTLKPEPYLYEYVQVKKYNPDYDQEAICTCGHPYYRHFDWVEDNYPRRK